ncbi:hypothetical protein RZE82_02920 [Mollicutes bacterium LVI A0039]|nr:hypothetical protein RZE82_02920 [Mollicutes bacterium LVI A0039]
MNKVYKVNGEKYLSFQLVVENHYPTLEKIYITFLDYFDNKIISLEYIVPIRPLGRINTYNNIFVPESTRTVLLNTNIVDADFKYVSLHNRELYDVNEDYVNFSTFKNIKYYSNEEDDKEYEKIVFLYNGMQQEYGTNSNKPLLLKQIQSNYPDTLFISLYDHHLPNGTYYSLFEGKSLFHEHIALVNYLAKKNKTNRILLCGSSAGGSFALKMGASLKLKTLVFAPQYNIETYAEMIKNKAVTILEYHRYYNIPSFAIKDYINTLIECNLLQYVYSNIDVESNCDLTNDFDMSKECFIKCEDRHEDVLKNHVEILCDELYKL